jgi:hypothetical protein
MKRLFACSIGLLVSMFLCMRAFAICDQSGASSSDIALFNAHGCGVKLPGTNVWFPRFYYTPFFWDVLAQSGWRDRGFFDACNINKEFTKHWNSAKLLEFGLVDNVNTSWHGSADYIFSARGQAPGSFHSKYFHRARDFQDGTIALWEFTRNPFADNIVTSFCPLFDPGSPFAVGAYRASAYVHEGWHGWQSKHLYRTSHFAGPKDGCKVKSCDYYYWHGVGDFEFGHVFEFTRDGRFFHSPFQIQVEFLCDVVQNADTWVPATVRMEAEVGANRTND